MEVALERRVRGAVERRYRLRRDRAGITADIASSLSLDDHRSGFAAALAVLTAEFTAYLDRETADLVADLVGYRQHAVWLNPAELHGMIDGMWKAIAPHLVNEPSPDRTRYLTRPSLLPVEAPPPESRSDDTAAHSQSPGTGI
uniref:ArsR family transcriptional regulator n=1 Tax=Streptomyces polyasparticus TaxID=2767826 RepID=UPI001F3042F0|nr:ArsR family transcriptional regulator [Streptomyces polyasparticus]